MHAYELKRNKDATSAPRAKIEAVHGSGVSSMRIGGHASCHIAFEPRVALLIRCSTRALILTELWSGACAGGAIEVRRTRGSGGQAKGYDDMPWHMQEREFQTLWTLGGKSIYRGSIVQEVEFSI